MTGTTANLPARRWRPVHGVLLLDKPVGLSSNHALQQARRLFQAEKAGHMGTLDPFASGLLPLCFGEATKFSRFVLDADKTYRATLRLGITTTTGDPEGDIIEARDAAHVAAHVTRTAVDAILARFHGTQSQIPPRHAALKYQGRAYYDYARAGIDIPRTARDIEIFSLTLIEFAPPALVIDAHVSKGTYIRTLAEDIGTALGCGAHLSALRRLHSGPFSMANAHTLETLAALSETEQLAQLLPIDTLTQTLPRVVLSPVAATRLGCGQRLALRDADMPLAATAGLYAVYQGLRFSGVAEVRDGALRPVRLADAQ